MKLPSVTEVLGPFTDFSRVPAAVLENAKVRGSKTHGICAALIQGLWVPEIPEECAGYVESFKLWLPVVEEVILVEGELVDQELGFLGHPDLVCRIKGDTGLAVPDYKTPAATSPTWKGQMAAYVHLVEKKYNEPTRGLTVRLRQNGSPPKVDNYQDSQRDFAAFLSALNAYRYFKAA